VRGRVSDFLDGVRLVGAGFGTWKSSSRLMVLGLLPGLLVAAVLAGVFIAIAVWVDDWSEAIARAATHDRTPSTVLVAVIALAIIGGSALLAIFTFTALTLLIGQPFFEAISDRVAARAGLAFTAAGEPWWRTTIRGVREGLGLLLFGVLVGVVTFLVGLIPVAGSAIAFTVAAFVGGSLLALELTAYPLSRVGIGVASYLVCLIPLGALLAMPALVSGGTLLAARLAADPT
jgi:CysZ protein